AAANDCAKAQYKLACLYADGIGVEQNDRLAAVWFYRAATRCNTEIKVEIALRFYHGVGVKTDIRLARQLLNQAALDGSPRAYYKLSMENSASEIEEDDPDRPLAEAIAKSCRANERRPALAFRASRRFQLED
ncbi:MAG: hypothetical protein K2Z81_26745, partial [Cyanobacteria bacterium]|nr:hypothetical protein [Cyanobacteriota bacterium]